MDWFKRRSRLGKIGVLAFSALLFLCLCAGLANLVSPAPDVTPTVAPAIVAAATDTPVPVATPILPAATAIPPVPTPTPAPVGMTRDRPAPAGQLVVADNEIEVTVLKLERDAWARIHGMNLFNPEPGEGMEYILATLRVTNLGDPAKTKSISSLHFRAVGDKGVIYDSPLMVVLEKELSVELFGGGTSEGQLALEVGQGEGNLVLIYDSGLDTEARYLSLE